MSDGQTPPAEVAPDASRLDVLVAGTYELDDAYPNVIGRIGALKRDERYRVVESRVSGSTRLDYSSRQSRLRSGLVVGARLIFGALGLIRSIVRHRGRTVLYVPYPCVPTLWLLGLLPRFLRPDRVVADAFISLYDTVVQDRRLLRPNSIVACLLRSTEGRAYRAADQIVVDTERNAAHYAALFDLSPEKLKPIPLATSYRNLDSAAYAPREDDRMRLLFVGTMVPLHGVDVLCEAVARLPERLPIDVHLYGDGQCSPRVRRLVEEIEARSGGSGGVRVVWEPRWLHGADLGRAVGEADLCVGVLGTTAKSARVWPFKNYLYMACGRALVTASTPAAVDVELLVGPGAFLHVAPGDAGELATLVERVARNKASLVPVAAAARQAFLDHLSGKTLDDALFEVMSCHPCRRSASVNRSPVFGATAVEQQAVTSGREPG